MARKVKVPRLFAARLSARVYEKKILPRIYIPSDRVFLEALYARQPDGSYRRPDSLEGDAARRLQELARAVGQNKGVVRLGKLSVIAVVAAGLLVFNLFFKDRLAEAGLERALEGIFSARAEVDDLRLRLLRGRVSFHRLAVADQEQPMRNLFELGRSAVSLDTAQLLRGRVLVRNLESRDVRWDTPRSTSGALAPSQPEPPAAERRRDWGLSLAGLDARALLEEQAGNLRSPEAVAALNARAEQMSRQWGGRLDDAEQTLRRLSDQVEALRSLEVGAVKTVAEAQQALRQIQGLYPTLQSAKQQVADIKQGLAADAQVVARERGTIAGLMEADLAHLRSLTDLSGGGLRGLLASAAAPYLERYLGRFSTYAWRVVQYCERLIGGRQGADVSADGTKAPEAKRRAGREVPFPVRETPRFLLQNMSASFGARGEAYYVRFSLQDLSSDPELTGAPVRFAAEIAREERTVAVAGRLDLRGDAQERVGAGLESFGQPLELSEGLEVVKLRQLKGRYDLRAELSLAGGGELRGAGRAAVRELVLESSGERDAISGAVYDALSAAPELTVDFRFSGAASGELRVTAETNLDESLGAQLKQNLAALGAQQEQRLRDELSLRLEGDLAGTESLQGTLSALQERSVGNLQDIAGHEKLLSQKRADLEARIRKLGGGVLKDLTGGLSLP